MDFMDWKFSSNISGSSIYTSILPVISAALSMYVHSSGSFLKTNYAFSIGIILASVANLIGSKITKTLSKKFEVVQLCIFIGLAAQFCMNLFRDSKYKFFINCFARFFEKEIFASLFPILFSFITDLLITTFLDRENAIMFKMLTSLLVAVGMLSARGSMLYDWAKVLPLLIIPSFLLIFCLPSAKSSQKKNKNLKFRRMSVVIGSLVLAITCSVLLTHILEKRMKINTTNLCVNYVKDIFMNIKQGFIERIWIPIKNTTCNLWNMIPSWSSMTQNMINI